jgi:hypothetical protein
MAAPVIVSVSPSNGPVTGGTLVTISGQNFQNGCRVKFGGVDSPQVTFVNATQLNAVTPPGAATGPVNVRVVNPDQTATAAQDAFQYVPAPPPSISSVQPSSGPATGGTQVVIAGQNFAADCQVKIGGVVAQLLSTTPTQLTVTTPPSQQGQGPVTVRVINADQQVAVAQNAFTYTAAPPPVVTSVIPTSGPVTGGTQVTIAGQNFMPGCQARFGGTDAQTTFNSGTQLTAVTPSAQAAGPINVRVVNPDQQAAVLQNAFTYLAPPPNPPVISSISPSSGPLSGGTQVTITGQNFMPGCQVKIGGNPAQTLSTASSQIIVATPQGAAAGPVNIRVVNPDQQFAVAQNAFTYLAPQPTTVQVVAPSGGTFQPGQSVTVQWQTNGPVSAHAVRLSINGGNFNDITQADLPGTARSYTFALPAPPASPAQAIIRVAAKDATGGQIAKGDSAPFTLTRAQAAAPVVTSFNPTAGPVSGGTQVTIFGQNFAGGCTVTFGATAAQIVNITSSQINVVAPPQPAPGPVALKVTNPDSQSGTAPGQFQYTAPPPPQTTVQVSAPAGGTFQEGQQLNVQWQTNGPVSAHAVRLSYDGGDFQNVNTSDLPANARNFTFPLPKPPKQSSQAVVRVAAKDASGSQVAKGDSSPFTVQQTPTPPGDPTITSITPNVGATTGGRSVTVKGSNFVAGASLFIGGNPAQNVQVVDSQTITAKTPARSTAGQVNVRVQNPDTKEATLAQGFRYNDAPSISEIAPDNIPVATDGRHVLISGAAFQKGAQVFFKDAAATVQSVSPDGTQLDVVVPRSDTAGSVRVRVLNPDEGEARKADGFTYLGPKQQLRARIRKVAPAAVLEGDTNTIVVYGTNLRAALGNVFGLRASGALKIVAGAPVPGNVPETGEETVTFSLQVTRKDGQPFDALQRAIIEIVASTRHGALKDGMVEAVGTLAVLARAVPVAISFTASVDKGKTSVVAVAGKNLKDTVLALDGVSGASLEHQFSDDNLSLALVSVDATAGNNPLPVKLLDKNSPGKPPLTTLSVKVNPPAAGARAQQVSDGEPDIGMSGLDAVKGQILLAPTQSDSRSYNLATGDGSTTPPNFPDVPDISLVPLVPIAQVTVAEVSFDIPLFSYARQLSLFDKGGKQIEDHDLVVRLGTIRSIRNLTLLLVLDIRLHVVVKLQVFLQVNPFADFDSTQFFLGPFEGNPGLPSGAFGAVVLGFRLDVELSVNVAFFAGLIVPQPPAAPGQPFNLAFKPLAFFLFNVTLDAPRRTLKLDERLSLTFSLSGTFNPLPLKFDGLKLLSDPSGLKPDSLGLGFAAFYFAAAQGRFCATFDYRPSGFTLNFSGPAEVASLPLVPQLTVCVDVKPSASYRIVRIEPSDIFLLPGQQEVVKAFARPVNLDGTTAGDEFELKASQVTFRPEDNSAQLFSATKGTVPGDPSERWRVTGLQDGAGKLLASVATTGKGNAILPGTEQGFFLPGDAGGDAEAEVAFSMVMVAEPAQDVELLLQNDAGAPIGDVWVYLKDEQQNFSLLRTGGEGTVRRLRPNGDLTQPDQYTAQFTIRQGAKVLIYYTRGALPLFKKRLDERSTVFLERTAAPVGAGKALIKLPDIKLDVSTPRELNLWPLLFELPTEKFQKSLLPQQKEIFFKGQVKPDVGEGMGANAKYGEAEANLRPRERGLRVAGTVDAAATRLTIQVLRNDADQTIIPLLQQPGGQATNQITVTPKKSGAQQSFEAAVYLADPTALFADGGLVQILVVAERGSNTPILGSFACQPVGLQIALLQDEASGQKALPVPTETGEIVVVDFTDSPSNDILAQGRARRMVAYPIGISKRGDSELPRQPQMPMWMAELQLVGLDKKHLEEMLGRRRRRQGIRGGILRLILNWKMRLSWHGPENVGRYETLIKGQNTSQGLTTQETVVLQLRTDSDQLAGVNQQNQAPAAISPPPVALKYPVPNRRVALVTVDGLKRRWGRRAGTPEYQAIVIEWQPAVTDAAGGEIIRGGDGELELESLSIDDASVDLGLTVPSSGGDPKPPDAGTPVAALPVFRVPGHPNLSFKDAFALADFFVTRLYQAESSRPYVGVLSLRCWQDTVHRVMKKESYVKHYKELPTQQKGSYANEAGMPAFGPPHDYGIAQISFLPITTDQIWSVVENLREAVRRIFEEVARSAYAYNGDALNFSTPGNATRSRAAFQRETMRVYNGGPSRHEFKQGSTALIQPNRPDNIDYPNGIFDFDFIEKDGTVQDGTVDVPKRDVPYQGAGHAVEFKSDYYGPFTSEPGVFPQSAPPTTEGTQQPVPPSVTGLTPASGQVGDIVSVAGTNFTSATAVQFNGTPASFVVNSATLISATVPAGAPTGPVSVNTPAGSASSPRPFTVVTKGKESKGTKASKEGKEDFEGLTGLGADPSAGLGQPFGKGAVRGAAEEQGRAFISPEERPAVGERALRGGGKERE